ncbi:DUF1516 family protein [Lactobacillus sp. LC28-10]|uniref:DUF1516 family protein n=1 Tax=Secundilactobacillus angelensis TaxID=2722706 RepID=A0ABX1L038_9LACO|nr:DUF1516 family protein [Secundilactobacillus angelensis]MCH5463164.1 DUF1516 family protein [Secundilactobacillus angelensis]NLR19543.1 DUF1516 family protein [Secundilactobacillus angelensis]
MWLTIYFVSLILLIPVTIIGLSRASEKRIAQWLIFDRLFYLIMACATVVLMIRTFNHAPLLVSLKGILAVIIILIIEIAFGRKQEHSLSIAWSIVITLIILFTAAVVIILTLHSI